MTDALVFLTSITLLLVAGLISVYLSKKTKFPLPLFLFATGAILGKLFYAGRPLVILGGSFLSSFSIIALLMVVFDATSRLRFTNWDNSMKESFAFFLLSLILNLIAVSYVAKFVFGLQWFVVILLSVMISCVEYAAIFSHNHTPNNKIAQFLKDESNVSCATMLVAPFLILTFMESVTIPLQANSFSQLISFFVNFFGGFGIGVIVSLLLFKMLYSIKVDKTISIVYVLAVLLAYILAERIDGNGLVAVATLGLIYANVFLKQKATMESHLHKLYSMFELFLFTIVGLVVGIPVSFFFFRMSLGLFVVYLIVRFISAQLTLRNCDFEEKMEIALFVPKGLATITIAFALLNYTFIGNVLLVQLLISFFVYSLIFDTILDKIGFYKHR